MHTGMLWFDNSTTTLSIKIQKAFEYYHKKYGRKPDLVLVHPEMLDTSERKGFIMKSGTIEVKVRPYRPVLIGHIWLGIEDKDETKTT